MGPKSNKTAQSPKVQVFSPKDIKKFGLGNRIKLEPIEDGGAIKIEKISDSEPYMTTPNKIVHNNIIKSYLNGSATNGNNTENNLQEINMQTGSDKEITPDAKQLKKVLNKSNGISSDLKQEVTDPVQGTIMNNSTELPQIPLNSHSNGQIITIPVNGIPKSKDSVEEVPIKAPKKRGRKSKAELELIRKAKAEELLKQPPTPPVEDIKPVGPRTRAGRISKRIHTYSNYVSSPASPAVTEAETSLLDVSVNETNGEIVKKPSKRGRKKKIKPAEEVAPPETPATPVEINNGLDSSTVVSTAEEIVEKPTPRKRGRKRKHPIIEDVTQSPQITATTVNEDGSVPASENAVLGPATEELGAKQMRLMVENLVNEIRKRMETAVEITKKPGQVHTCALCKTHFKMTEWTYHRLHKHNNLAWRVSDEPIDLSNHHLVISVLKRQYPYTPYRCNFCSDKKKTVHGYLGHKLSCSKTPEEIESLKVKCKECEKMLMPNQLVDHAKSHLEEAENPSKKPKIDDAVDYFALQYKAMYKIYSDDVKKQIATAQPSEPKSADHVITCAICLVHLKPLEWTFHKLRKHNNIAWRTNDPPLDLDNYGLIMGILNALYPSKPYYCNECDDVRKSVYGLFSHKVTCNKTVEEIDSFKVPCPECGVILLPNRLIDHGRVHKKEKLKLLAPETPAEEVKENVVSDVDTPRKRNAAQKATQLIEKLTKQEASTNDGPLVSTVLKKYFVKSDFSHDKLSKAFSKLFESKIDAKCKFEKCDLMFSNVEELKKHLVECDHKLDSFFTCIFCLDIRPTISDIRDHLKSKHNDELAEDMDGNIEVPDICDDEDDDDDEDDEECTDADESGDDLNSRKSRKSTSNVPIHINANWKLAKFSNLLKGASKTFEGRMRKFCEKYYTELKLFTRFDFNSQTCVPLDVHEFVDYLPVKKRSMSIQFNGQESRTFKLFETVSTDDFVNIFCGGSITAMAWLPTPFDKPNCDQLLAIAVDRYMETIDFCDMESNKSVIQLWNCGVLDNSKGFESTPSLGICIAHDYGLISYMQWCPSGCYNPDDNRLGLLSVCTSESLNVYCYSIKPSYFNIRTKLVQLRPIFALVLYEKLERKFASNICLPTQLTWSKGSQHKFVAIGYTNGLVALYNLELHQGDSQEGTTKRDVNDKQQDLLAIYPYRVIRAHTFNVTALQLHHLDGGNRWLVTSSTDRIFKFWDLHRLTEKPLISTKRATANNIFWPIDCLSVINANDDSSNSAFLFTSSLSLVEFNYHRPVFLLYGNSPVRCVSGSDWCGVVYQCNEAGEISTSIFRDLYPFVLEPCCKRFICSTASIRVDKPDDEDNEGVNGFKNYEDIAETCTLVFDDYKLNSTLKMPKLDRGVSKTAEYVDYPAESAMVICTNNNRQSYAYTAIGYKIGLVRIMYSKFINSSCNKL